MKCDSYHNVRVAMSNSAEKHARYELHDTEEHKLLVLTCFSFFENATCNTHCNMLKNRQKDGMYVINVL